MFIAISKYLKPLSEVDAYRPAHHQYIKPLFESGHFLISGRQNPPVGGVIISKLKSIEEFKTILDNDPFTKAGVAEYHITEFAPAFYDQALKSIIDH
jgi:uncharacterized protein YciI